jgi:hypothetical protein
MVFLIIGFRSHQPLLTEPERPLGCGGNDQKPKKTDVLRLTGRQGVLVDILRFRSVDAGIITAQSARCHTSR